MITAKWKEGFGTLYKGTDAQTVAEEIVAIGESASPQQILDKARDEDTELHKCFEWDDSIAAEKFRLHQARNLVCHLVIKEDAVPADRPEIRFFVKPANTVSYRKTEIVVKNKDEYAMLLEKAYAELRAFKLKYACLQELSEILALI